ncbi:MAG TPA: hypothetical protein VN648_26640, partial [Candidatus Methylomirabilis sp.]|nr:hypothetical protein [Candidatus Methylomirabilis sp.]
MTPALQGYRVAVVGASSLLGEELLTVLEERSFPVSRLLSFEDPSKDDGLPIVDLSGRFPETVASEDIGEG